MEREKSRGARGRGLKLGFGGLETLGCLLVMVVVVVWTQGEDCFRRFKANARAVAVSLLWKVWYRCC